jgi:hypothetical protein
MPSLIPRIHSRRFSRRRILLLTRGGAGCCYQSGLADRSAFEHAWRPPALTINLERAWAGIEAPGHVEAANKQAGRRWRVAADDWGLAFSCRVSLIGWSHTLFCGIFSLKCIRLILQKWLQRGLSCRPFVSQRRDFLKIP